MAIDAGLNLNRAVLMVAARAFPGRGHMPRMIERNRFVDLRQAAQREILRMIIDFFEVSASFRRRSPAHFIPGCFFIIADVPRNTTSIRNVEA